MANNKAFKSDLQNANSLNDIFTIVSKHYDTSVKLGTITKQVIILNIDKLINASGAKLKP